MCVAEERERRRHSQAVQRGLPRPSDINLAGLKSSSHQDQKHQALFDAEELVKMEMVVMLRHDLVHHPTLGGSRNKAGQRAWRKALDEEPLDTFTDEELAEVGGREEGEGRQWIWLCQHVLYLICMVCVSVMVVRVTAANETRQTIDPKLWNTLAQANWDNYKPRKWQQPK